MNGCKSRCKLKKLNFAEKENDLSLYRERNNGRKSVVKGFSHYFENPFETERIKILDTARYRERFNTEQVISMRIDEQSYSDFLRIYQ